MKDSKSLNKRGSLTYCLAPIKILGCMSKDEKKMVDAL